jgi:hypothetical protein
MRWIVQLSAAVLQIPKEPSQNGSAHRFNAGGAECRGQVELIEEDGRRPGLQRGSL